MKYLFFLGHPAHYHLFKNSIKQLKKKCNQVFIIIKSKDVLRNLLDNNGLSYYDILPGVKKKSKISIVTGMLKREIRLFKYCSINKPDLLLGTSSEITHIGKLLNIPSVVFEEDDYEVIPEFAKITYPFANTIIVPECCSVGKWKSKTITYNSYHELAYLSPKYFNPNKNILNKLNCVGKDFFILRFVSLNANHDNGINGINDSIAERIIKILKPYGKIFITSERKLVPEFEQYRITLNPSEILDALYYARLFVGDSQTMSAEAGILGTPFIRFNDFVGKISYLEELENKYQVGYGIKTNDVNNLFLTIRQLLKTNQNIWRERSKQIFEDKIDLTEFISWFLKNYPESIEIIKMYPDYHLNFKLESSEFCKNVAQLH